MPAVGGRPIATAPARPSAPGSQGAHPFVGGLRRAIEFFGPRLGLEALGAVEDPNPALSETG